MDKIYRILDANINRVAEGVRVLEDIARFYFEEVSLTENFREFRHGVRDIAKKFDVKMVDVRDSEHDIGAGISQGSDLDKKEDLKSLVLANSKRVTEGLRVLEESLKISDEYSLGKKAEQLRYRAYFLEKEILSLFKKEIPKGIYGITSHKNSNGKSTVEVVKDMIEAGVKIIQYREKEKSLKEKYIECVKIRKITKKNNVIFIVNDHIDLAMMIDADGVHLGQDDFPVKEARKILGPHKIIGLSTHSKKQADKAIKEDIDYIGVGPIYTTPTKENYEAVGLEYVEYVDYNVDIPYIAIGGIDMSNLNKVVSKGAKRVAMVRSIVGAESIVDKVKEVNKVLGI